MTARRAGILPLTPVTDSLFFRGRGPADADRRRSKRDDMAKQFPEFTSDIHADAIISHSYWNKISVRLMADGRTVSIAILSPAATAITASAGP